MDFETAADRLYAVPREEFIGTRDELVAQAKAEGDERMAKDLKALRKPSTSAWLVNQLARMHPADLEKLAELGEQLRAAHTELAGDKLRTLSARRHEALRALVDQSRSIGRDAGTPVSQSVAEEVQSTLETTLGDEDTTAQVAQGRLTGALEPGTAEGWFTAGAMLPAGWDRPAKRERTEPSRSTTKERAPAARPQKTEKPASDAREKGERQRRRRIERAEEQLAEAEEALARARTERGQADEEASRAQDEVRDLRSRLSEAERKATKAREAVLKTRQRHDKAERAERAARRDLQRLRASEDS